MALKMQRLDVEDFLAEIPLDRFNKWAEYYQLEPWGSIQVDHELGVIAAILVNQWRKSGSSPVMPSDLFPHLKKAKRHKWQTMEECREAGKRMAVVMEQHFGIRADGTRISEATV